MQEAGAMLQVGDLVRTSYGADRVYVIARIDRGCT